MARTQGFDRDTVVRAARTLFWRQGYEDASVPDLERATGLSRSSLYNTFGSKRGLFDAAVESYLEEVVRPRLRPLTRETVAAGAVVDYLAGLRGALQRGDTMPAENGCLLVNSAGAPIARDAPVARVIADYRDELHRALSRGISALRPALSPGERDRLGDAVTGLVMAAFTLARIDPAQASGTLTAALHLIGEPDS
ncbi:TetR/AcrR family transcriptional regulator [Citricoccus nitrophenolicus]|uniref:TetR/AcrR family transcriptional regulator n=1 Tax=Citricoccus nitrophenolicus TaxID=863575 RepID=UPI0031E8B67A